MKRLKKILLWLLVILAVAIGGGISYLMLAFPKVDDAPELTIEVTPELVAKGEYLANHVSACMDCHG